ncbi:MAG: YraN family protein [Endomicrobium sp.]|jgi:putative endonuclease|nr:YraN family protein [Endomicrobium sp.]
MNFFKTKTTRDIGFDKEKKAIKHIKNLKYKILATNFTTNFGEIDIIAKDKDILVFIEVRYRKSLYSGTPQESVRFTKQQKIIKSAIVYMKINNIKSDIRFDIIAICNDEIELIKSAFVPMQNQYYI